MNCPKCRSELEIFPRHGKEIYVCPLCLSALLPDESSLEVLKYFCTQEIISRLISRLLEDSFFDNSKEMLSADEDVSCPKCKSHMYKYDFEKKIRFEVNRCVNCGAVWGNSMQLPLLAVVFIENTPEGLSFKNSVNKLYRVLAAKRPSGKIRPFDEIIAPFAVITGLVPAVPVADNVLTSRPHVITRSFIVICVFVFLLQLLLGERMLFFSLISEKISVQREWYRLVTYAFLHGGIFHLLGNMFFLRVFGRSVEGELGWKKYLALLFLGAVLSGIFFMATTHKKDVSCVGASGVISAFIGAYLVLFPKSRIRFNIIHPLTFQKLYSASVPSLYYILFWIIMNVFFAAFQSGRGLVNVAYWGHIGGFVTGIIFIEVYKSLKRR